MFYDTLTDVTDIRSKAVRALKEIQEHPPAPEFTTLPSPISVECGETGPCAGIRLSPSGQVSVCYTLLRGRRLALAVIAP